MLVEQAKRSKEIVDCRKRRMWSAVIDRQRKNKAILQLFSYPSNWDILIPRCAVPLLLLPLHLPSPSDTYNSGQTESTLTPVDNPHNGRMKVCVRWTITDASDATTTMMTITRAGNTESGEKGEGRRYIWWWRSKMKLTLTLRLTSERFPDIGWRETAFIRGGHCNYTKTTHTCNRKKRRRRYSRWFSLYTIATY